VSELLDRFVPGAGSHSQPEEGGGGDGPSAFDRFLETLVPGTPPADEFKRAVLYAALGGVLVFAAGVILAPLPSKETILGSGFYWLGHITLAKMMGLFAELVTPLILFGLFLLAATGIVAALGDRIDRRFTDGFCVALPIIGVGACGLALLAWLILIAVFAINLLGYIIIGFIALAILGAVLGGLAQ
jgi:hypothetical protein